MQIQVEKNLDAEIPTRTGEDLLSSVSSSYSIYRQLSVFPSSPPPHWKESCVKSECSLHQLSPYIGKLKSSIARDLILLYSKPGDLVVDPFSGSGTVPLESSLLGRRVFAADISPYSKILSMAKLSSPPSLNDALNSAESSLKQAAKLPEPDLRRVPDWVRAFFHPGTLKEAIRFASVCNNIGNAFLMACFLGILHHQRPGFLSYPSSHLVPYLRTKKYPADEYPELYEYRPLRPRLLAKIMRAYRNKNDFEPDTQWTFRQSKIENLTFPGIFDCLITSPPYMNTLDYGRDNRLRLWFIDPGAGRTTDNPVTREKKAFQQAMVCLARNLENHLRRSGYCILIVGERISGRSMTHLSEEICRVIFREAPSLRLISLIKDWIPDIRRSRKNCSGTKSEHILVFQRSPNAKEPQASSIP